MKRSTSTSWSSTDHKPAAHSAASPPPARAKVDSRQLLGNGNELVIVHHGREYRLQLTIHGRLILTA